MPAPLHVESLLDEGIGHRDDGELEKAIAAWWLYVSDVPGSQYEYSALLLIADALIDLKDYDSAIRTAERAASLYPGLSPPFFIVAKAYGRIDMPRSAIKVMVDGFRRVAPSGWPLPVDPRDTELHPMRLYAQLLVDVGWHYEAMQVVNECLVTFPGDKVFMKLMKESIVGDARDRRYNL